MKYLKLLGLAAVASMALLVLGAGSASATTLTCTEPAGVKVQCKAGTIMSASLEGSMLLKAGFANITCTAATTQDEITNAGSSTETVKAKVQQLTFSNCSAATVVVLKNGSGELHTSGASANNNGTLTGAESEVTVSIPSLGTSCVYGTKTGTDLGTVTGSTTTGGTAKIDISAQLPLVSGTFACANPGAWTANYKVTTPDWLNVD